jgi:hypothetical protein
MNITLVGMKQILSFDNNVDNNNLNKDLELESNNNKIKKNSSNEIEGDPLENNNKFDFIDDLPFGCKLINSIRQGYRTKKMQLWKIVRNANNIQNQASFDLFNTINAHVPVVGSVEWSLAKIKQGENNSNNNDYDEDKIEIESKNFTSTWRYFQISNDTSSCSMVALLGRQNLNSVSMHCGGDTLYGVSHSILEILCATGSKMCVERTTLLPLGSRWLSLALLCMHINPFKIINTQNDENFINSPITKDDTDCCTEIYNEILESCYNSIEENQYLVKLINILFCEWNENNHIQLLKRLQNTNSNNYFISPLQFEKNQKNKIIEDIILNSNLKTSPSILPLVPSHLLTKKKKVPITSNLVSPPISQVNSNNNYDSNTSKTSNSDVIANASTISRKIKKDIAPPPSISHQSTSQSNTPLININYKEKLFGLLQKYYSKSFKIGTHLIIETNKYNFRGIQTIITLTDFLSTGENNVFTSDYCITRKDSESHAAKLAYLNENVRVFYQLSNKQEIKEESKKKSKKEKSKSKKKKELKREKRKLEKKLKKNTIDYETKDINKNDKKVSIIESLNNVILNDINTDKKYKAISAPVFRTGMAIISKDDDDDDDDGSDYDDDGSDDENFLDLEMANIIANMNLNSDSDEDINSDDDDDIDVYEYI